MGASHERAPSARGVAGGRDCANPLRLLDFFRWASVRCRGLCHYSPPGCDTPGGRQPQMGERPITVIMLILDRL